MCVRIGIRKNNYYPPYYDDVKDSYEYLDLYEDFSLRLTKRLEELTDINTIKTDNVLGFSVPATPKNDAFLKYYVLPNRKDPEYDGIPVLVTSGSHAFTQDRLYVLSRTKDEYECELRPYIDHWAIKAEKTTLNQIKYRDDPFEFTTANILAIQALDEYTDGDEIIRFPVVSYGRFTDNTLTGNHVYRINRIGVPDFRPFLSVLGVLQKGFCHIGWDFRSPILESDYGRRLLTYILSNTMGEDENSLDSRALETTYLTTTVIDWATMNYTPIQFTATKDLSGGWDGTKYHTAGVYDVEYNIQLNLTVPPATAGYILSADQETPHYIYIRICFDAPDGSHALEKTELSFTAADLVNAPNWTYVMNIKETRSNFQLDAGSKMYITINCDDDFVTTNDFVIESISNVNTYLKLKCTHAIYDTGDSIEIEKIVSKEYNLLDFTKGIAHLFNAKFITDYTTKTVWMFPPYPRKIWDDEDVEGFFKINDDYINLTTYQDMDSEVIQIDDIDRERYILYKFKGSGDDAIKKLNLPKENPYLSYKVDLGKNLKNEKTQTEENPFFEATYNDYYTDPDTGALINMPFMLDNSANDKGQYELSYDIAPRILYWMGNVHQVGTASGGLTYKEFIMFGTKVNEIPMAFQWTDEYIGDFGNHYQPEINVGYGEHTNKKRPNYTNKNLFKFFYADWLREFLNALSSSVLVNLSQALFLKLSFRNVIKLNILGRETFGVLNEITDFQTCNTTTTPLNFIPFIQINPCDSELDIRDNGGGGGIGTDDCIQNHPELIITKNDDCYEFSIGGTTNSPIDDVVFEYQYVGDETWTEDDTLCNPTAAFKVKVTVTYEDDCPPSVLTQLVNICGYLPVIIPTWDEENQCFTLDISGVDAGLIDAGATIIEYSLDDGDTWETYAGTCVPVTEEDSSIIMVRAEVHYTDSCSESEIETTFEVPIILPCTATDADVFVDEYQNLVLTGHVYGDDALDIVRYRYLNPSTMEPETDYWYTWDGLNKILPQPFEYQRVIIFCGGQCPTYCTDIKVWEEPAT